MTPARKGREYYRVVGHGRKHLWGLLSTLGVARAIARREGGRVEVYEVPGLPPRHRPLRRPA